MISYEMMRAPLLVVRIEWPTDSGSSGLTARLLDRLGSPLPVLLTVRDRSAIEGHRAVVELLWRCSPGATTLLKCRALRGARVDSWP